MFQTNKPVNASFDYNSILPDMILQNEGQILF